MRFARLIVTRCAAERRDDDEIDMSIAISSPKRACVLHLIEDFRLGVNESLAEPPNPRTTEPPNRASEASTYRARKRVSARAAAARVSALPPNHVLAA
jgi:hypothetical protein